MTDLPLNSHLDIDKRKKALINVKERENDVAIAGSVSWRMQLGEELEVVLNKVGDVDVVITNMEYPNMGPFEQVDYASELESLGLEVTPDLKTAGWRERIVKMKINLEDGAYELNFINYMDVILASCNSIIFNPRTQEINEHQAKKLPKIAESLVEGYKHAVSDNDPFAEEFRKHVILALEKLKLKMNTFKFNCEDPIKDKCILEVNLIIDQLNP